MRHLIVFAFVILRTLDGAEIRINSEQITSMQSGRDGEGNKLLTDRARCAIGLTNGRFFSVADPCDVVMHMLLDAEQKETPP